MNFDPSTIMNLVGQLGGDHPQAAQQLQGMGQVDSQQHAGMLSGLGVDPQQLENGGYQQHFDAQQQPGFAGYQPGAGNYTDQQPSFDTSRGQGYSQQDGGQEQRYAQGGQEQGGQRDGYGEQQGGRQEQGYDQVGQEQGFDQGGGQEQGYGQGGGQEQGYGQGGGQEQACGQGVARSRATREEPIAVP